LDHWVVLELLDELGCVGWENMQDANVMIQLTDLDGGGKWWVVH